MTPEYLPIAILYGLSALILMVLMAALILRRVVHESATLYKLKGAVWKDSSSGFQLLKRDEFVKPAESALALREAWEREMKIAFPQGVGYEMIYDCVVREARTA